jgi:type VI secretion system secreted protein VgrG
LDSHLDFGILADFLSGLSGGNRAIRMHIAMPDGLSKESLLPQHIRGEDAICDGFTYYILCVADNVSLPLKAFIAQPIELQIVTDRGDLRRICGIITEAAAGQSDGALATYQLVMRDALSILEKRINTRVFRNKNELDIIEVLLDEWRGSGGAIAAAFDYEFDQSLLDSGLPKREFTMQHNESDAAFIRRLLKRRGIAWFFRPGESRTHPSSTDKRQAPPVHTLVMFTDESHLDQCAAGAIRYHRDDATEQRDSITLWSGVRSLQPGAVALHSWNYANPGSRQFMATRAASAADQGESGNQLAASLLDYRIEVPHAGSDSDDLCMLGHLRMARHDYLSKCFHGEASVRDMGTGEWFELEDHPDIDSHPLEQRRFVLVAQQIEAGNNLPKEIGTKVARLFVASGWGGEWPRSADLEDGRFRSRFTCVRRGVAIVPAFERAVDVPQARLQSAIVVGPPGEEVHCDAYGRVKIRFPGTVPGDHAHASGAGAVDDDNDSPWIRVASNWAGNGPGSHQQCGSVTLPRIGTEVMVDFMGGDPDRPVIVAQLYNTVASPPGLSALGDLPGNKYLSGMRSREAHGTRSNTMRFDDTPGQISAQLASDHGASALNLGWLTQERSDGMGEPRGEGAELRSDKAVAVRGGHGVLISAARASSADALLARTAILGVADAAQTVTQHLTELAEQHQVASAEGAQLTELIDGVRHWENGSNTAPQLTEGGGRSILAAGAEAGTLISSQNNIAVAAQTRIDLASVGDTQISAGRSLFLRAARGINLVAFKLGLKLVAAAGELRIEAHAGDIVITCPKRIRIVAGEGVQIESPDVKIVAKGAQADFGGGQITQQSSGNHIIKSACFDQLDAGDGNPAGVTLPSTEANHDQQVKLIDMMTSAPASRRKYRITTEDGIVHEGVTDSDGLTARLKTKTAFAGYRIELLD